MELLHGGSSFSGAPTAEQRLRSLVMGFMDDFCSRDVSRLRKWVAESCVLSMPPIEPIRGASRVLAAFRIILRNNFSEVFWKVTDIYPVGPKRCIYACDSWGVIGKNTPYKNSLLTIIDFDADGRITFISDYFKDTAIFACARKGS
jgi:hypothetical protein